MYIHVSAINNVGRAKVQDAKSTMVMPKILKIKEPAIDLTGSFSSRRFVFSPKSLLFVMNTVNGMDASDYRLDCNSITVFVKIKHYSRK